MPMVEVRCQGIVWDNCIKEWRTCNRKLGKVEGKAELKCHRCGKTNIVDTERLRVPVKP